MVIYIKKLFTFIILFFLFNINHIDSNSDKRLIYNLDHIYDDGFYHVYFVNSTIDELRDVFNILDLQITSYIIEDRKYYARNINILEENLLKNKSIDEKVYYDKYGIKIDGINVLCNINELIKLEKMVDIY